MRMKKLRQGLSTVLALAMVITGSVCFEQDTVQAAAKGKAVLKSKKISIQVGKKKKIQIRKKNKKANYVFKSSKRKVAAVSKKGIITAKKAGTAKITVKEKSGKKVRSLGKVKVVVTAKKKTNRTTVPVQSQQPSGNPVVSSDPSVSEVPSSVPTDNPENPSASPDAENTPDPYAGLQWEKIDLSAWTSFNVTDNCMYDTNTGIFNAADQEYFGFQLSQDMTEGEYVIVRVKGTNSGTAGFRSWLVDATTATCCANEELYFYTQDKNEEFTVGDFEITYKLTASADCSYLFFKGASYGTNIENLSIHSIEISYSDKKQTVSFSPTEEQNAKMVSDSLISTGNNARIKAVIEQAKAGEDVTLAYIGGSVTEGQGAAPNANCYAQYSCNEFSKAYGTGENVHFVNGGMSGTPSSLGIIRYDRDILGQISNGDVPDILFVEFAVNDSGECTNGGAYEGLIRRALKSGSAVILIFSVFRDNWNMQDTYIPYGEYYDLPMVSMKDAVSSCINDQEGFRKWYFSDSYHPTNAGYKLTSDCIMNLFEKIDSEEVEADNINDVAAIEPMNTDAFEGTTMMGPETVSDLLGKENSSLLEFNAGGFSETDSSTGTYLYDSSKEKFENNWMHTEESGSAAFTAKVNCKNLMVVYKLSNASNTGTAELYVDGVKKVTMNGYNKDGWNNATTVLAFKEDEIAEHTIEIKMADGNEEKEFTLLALGYN